MPIEKMFGESRPADSGGYWFYVKEWYVGRRFSVVVATPEGEKAYTGRLVLLTFPFQLLVKDVPRDELTPLRLHPTSDYDKSIQNNGKFGLDARITPWSTNMPTNTVRAYFTHQNHAIKEIKFGEKVVFANPIIPPNYGPLDYRAEREFRTRLGYPIQSSI